MKRRKSKGITFGDERGAVAVITAIVLLFVILGIAALAIDIGRMTTVRNELQNAADAGALAGTAALYNVAATEVNTGANQIAFDTAKMNMSMNEPVDINWTVGTNNGDVQRGHWSFGSKKFTADDSTKLLELWKFSDEELDIYDADNPFINAVRVVTRRQVSALFARNFSREVTAEAIAYIGFAAGPYDIDFPMGWCSHAIKDDDGNIKCDTGIKTPDTIESAKWTNLSVGCETPTGGSSLPSVFSTTTCQMVALPAVTAGVKISTTKGDVTSFYRPMRDCWIGKSNNKTKTWQVRIPVIDCDNSPCNRVVGVIEADILWMTPHNAERVDGANADVPRKMYYEDASEEIDWWCGKKDDVDKDDDVAINSISKADCWAEFVEVFQITSDAGGDLWEKEAVYLAPHCDKVEPVGRSGASNFGILAEIPILVR